MCLFIGIVIYSGHKSYNVRYTRTPPIRVNAAKSITRTTNQRPYKWTAVAGYTVNAESLTLVGRESYRAHAFCANKRLVPKSTLAIVPFWFGGIETWLEVIRRSTAITHHWRAHPNEHLLTRWILLSFTPATPPRPPLSRSLFVFSSSSSVRCTPHFRFAGWLTSEATPLCTSTPPHDYALSEWLFDMPTLSLDFFGTSPR